MDGKRARAGCDVYGQTTGAMVLECSTLPPFVPAIQRAIRLLVFDVVTFTNLMYEVACRKDFPEYFD